MKKRVAIACQGGGSHTSFTAGVLKGLLGRGSDDHEFVALSGTSGGAICALLGWYALLEHGSGPEAATKAAELLEKFWLEENSATQPAERIMNDWTISFMRWQKATGLMIETSPNALSDYWQNQLRKTIEDSIPFDKIDENFVKPESPQLFIGAVDVLSGMFKVFRSHTTGESPTHESSPEDGISVDAILASAAIPPIFRSVRIGSGVYWDGLFSQNPPVRELLDARPDEVWVVQINQNSITPPPRSPAPGDEPTSIVDILDRRNALAGNLSLNQELLHLEEINDLVEELGDGDDPRERRIFLKSKGREYRRTVVRQIEMSLPLGVVSKLDRNPKFISGMMSYGERRAEEFFTALDFERAWVSRDENAILTCFSGDAEVRLGRPFSENTTYCGEEEIRKNVVWRLAGDGVRLDLSRKQIAGDTVSWKIRVAPKLCGESPASPPVEAAAEAVFSGGKISSLTLAGA